jgi:galactofuranosylgalactofuranosylrhamnosyl-N-acetylglucosaminyl-diphospho-decaprenol beta-1,5/1,6-galactofuranosyltransferase
MDYYVMRNGYITAWLHENDFSAAVAAAFTVRRVLAALLSYRYEKAAFMLEGIKDALAGPGFLKELDPVAFHTALAQRQGSVMKPVDPLYFASEKYAPQIAPSYLRRCLIILTLNGHLLPSFLMASDKTVFRKGWAIEPLHAHRFQAIFRKPTVLYYEPVSGQGVLCRMDRKRFFHLLGCLLRVCLRLCLKGKRIGKTWRESHRELTFPAFWKLYLGLIQPPSQHTRSGES